MNLGRPLALVLALTTSVACMPSPDRAVGYGTRAPRTPPSLDDVPVDGYHVQVKFEDGRRLAGELLFAEAGGDIAVRTKRNGEQQRAFADVRRATVVVDRRAHRWLIGLGTATAVLLPLSLLGGYYAIFLLPVVGAGGSMSMGIAWAESRVVLRDESLSYLQQYARWPQGRPQPVELQPSTPIEPEPEPLPIEPLPIEPQPLAR